MSRRRFHSHEDFPLPWHLEVFFWVVGLACVPIAIWWFINEITSPAATFGALFGVPVETQGIVDSAQPMIWLFGLLVGVRIRCWLRRAVLNRLNQVL